MKKQLAFGAALTGMFLPTLVFAQSTATTADFGGGLLSTLVYAFVGIILSFLVYGVIDMVTPGHLAKQLAHDKNIALAIVVGSVMLGISIIIAASIHG